MVLNAPFLRAIALLASLAVSTALVAGFFGRVHPAFDSFAHFRAHLAAALAVCAVLLVIARLRWNGAVAGLLAVGALVTTLPASLLSFTSAQAAQTPSAADQPVYRLLQLNLRWNHPDPNRVLSLIGRVQPDVVTLDEVSPMWAEKLALLKAAYPYQLMCDVPYFGTAILSRRPMTDNDRCADHGALSVATVDFGGRSVDIGAVHLEWPWPYAQPRQITRLETPLAMVGETAIVAGDLNATTWSAAARRVLAAGGLTMVDGLGPTWIDYMFPRAMLWAGLPIDHVMIKGAIQPHGIRTLEDVGSDHWPVLLEFSLAPPEGEPKTAMAALSR